MLSGILKIFEKKLLSWILNYVKKDFIETITKESAHKYKSINNLLKKFEIIQKNILCAHNDIELYIMYAMMLKLHVDGPIVEFGCYKGGSTAKLSLICELMGKDLYVFDSFEGLPPPSDKDLKHQFMPFIKKNKFLRYFKGDYTASLQEVKLNVSKYGNKKVCKFEKGFFKATLSNFKLKPSCIFMDVDLIDSALLVIKNVWPKLHAEGLFFTHEAGVINYIEAITDPSWWNRELGQHPPLLYGAGYGLGWRWKDFSFPSNVAYFKKPEI